MAQKDPCSNDEVATVGGEGGDEIEEGRKVETEIVGTNEAQQMALHATTTRPSPVGLTGNQSEKSTQTIKKSLGRRYQLSSQKAVMTHPTLL